jgi:hypothetical protein
MQPTEEQALAVELFRSGVGLAIEAGAGTGKTSTLQFLAASTKDPGTYVAFNRAIVDEAKRKMPRTIRSSTAHGLAYKAVGNRFEHRLKSERMRSDKVARLLGVEYLVIEKYDGGKKVIQASTLSSLVQRAIANFCFSADDGPGIHHVPWVEGIDPPDRSSRANNDLVRQHIRLALGKAWADLTLETGGLRFTHDVYLKLWQLQSPKIPGRFVLFDEAQDAAPVMLAAVQAQEGKQLVYVGDSQQQIYEWRGAVNALQNVGAEAVAYLSESFRFGEPVADLANVVLSILEADLRLTGRGGPTDVMTSHMDDPDAILTRSNAEAVTQVLTLQREGRRPYLVGGANDVVWFAEAAATLMAGATTDHPELACFDSWGEVKAYVADDPMGNDLKLLVDLIEEFGVPTIVGALKEMPEERDSDVCVSTAHKAKGREWNRVQIAGDFQEPEPTNLGEWRLLYVALTRARQALDVSACEPLRELAVQPRMDLRRTSPADRLLAAFPA